MSFLPLDYKSPSSPSSYTKIEEGETKIRILTKPIFGWEDWKDKKPVRFRMENKPEKSIDPEKPFRHFWAFIIWNYKTEKIEIFMLTQRTLHKKIEFISKDADWGDPFTYDLKITKRGQLVNTTYELSTSPHRELDVEIKNKFHEVHIDLEELYTNGDPFSATEAFRTRAFWEYEATPPATEVITPERALSLDETIKKHITPADKTWRGKALEAFKINSFEKLERRYYESFLKRIEDKKASLLADECPF